MARSTIEAQLAKIRKAKDALEKKEKALLNRTGDKVIAKIIQMAIDNGITALQITDAMKSAKPRVRSVAKKSTGSRGKVAPKYRNPANADQTWTGRGKPPVWVKALKDSGSLDVALITSAVR